MLYKQDISNEQILLNWKTPSIQSIWYTGIVGKKREEKPALSHTLSGMLLGWADFSLNWISKLNRVYWRVQFY